MLKTAKPIDFNSIVKQLSDRQKDNATSIIQRQLERYVAPFNSNVQFALVIEDDGQDVTYFIVPLDNAASTNLAGDIVTSAQIVNWLNHGTSVRYAVFPEGYSQGTSPGNLSTSTPDGADAGYIDFNSPEPGITPRKFLEQITEENRSLVARRLKDKMKVLQI